MVKKPLNKNMTNTTNKNNATSQWMAAGSDSFQVSQSINQISKAEMAGKAFANDDATSPETVMLDSGHTCSVEKRF